MWTTDFVEEVRPAIHRKIQRVGQLPDGVPVAELIAVADQATDLLKQCVGERGLNYCRYAGSNPEGVMMDAYTIDGENSIAPENRHNYRYIKTGLDYEISMITQDAGGNFFRFQTTRFGKPLYVGGEVCHLGCWCDPRYGR